MTLIQDLQGRKFTGCRGCDAVRSILYKGMDLWKTEQKIQVASTLDSFNASNLGAFTQSKLKARNDDECAVSITSVAPSIIATGQYVTVVGTGFGATTSTSDLNSAQDKSGTNVAQTVRSWSDTEVQFTTAAGALTTGTTVYLFIDCQTVGTAVTLEAGVNWTYAEFQIQSGGTVNLSLLIQNSQTYTTLNSPLNSDNLDVLGYHTMETHVGTSFGFPTPVSCFEVFSNMDIHEYGSSTTVPDTNSPGSPMIEHEENDGTPIQYFPLGAECGSHTVGGTKWYGYRGPGPAS